MIMNKHSIEMQITALNQANDLMKEWWGECTNQVGFDFCEQKFVKELANAEWVSPFCRPVNGAIKPWLYQAYVDMNNSMIKILERRLEALNEQPSS